MAIILKIIIPLKIMNILYEPEDSTTIVLPLRRTLVLKNTNRQSKVVNEVSKPAIYD